MLGYDLSEYEIEAVVPLDENPHKGYRGNILGRVGQHDRLRRCTTSAVPSGSIGSAYPTKRTTATGPISNASLGPGTRPWSGSACAGEGYSVDQWDADGDRYQLTTYMHVMTAYGFDEDGVYLTDPGQADLAVLPLGRVPGDVGRDGWHGPQHPAVTEVCDGTIALPAGGLGAHPASRTIVGTDHGRTTAAISAITHLVATGPPLRRASVAWSTQSRRVRL